jgi:hypothetical protein
MRHLLRKIHQTVVVGIPRLMLALEFYLLELERFSDSKNSPFLGLWPAGPLNFSDGNFIHKASMAVSDWLLRKTEESNLFPSGFVIKIVYAIIIFLIRVKCYNQINPPP